MRHLPVLLWPRLLGAGLLFGLAALLAVPGVLGQTTSGDVPTGGNPGTSGGGTTGGNPTTGGTGTGSNPGSATPGGTPNLVGYGSIANGTVPSSTYSFVTGMTSGTVFVVPFSFNSLGNYSLTSVSLLLSSSSGTANTSDFSLNVFSTLPTSLSLPTAVTTFSATGTIASNQAIYTFNASSAPTLAADTTYYLGVSYGGTDSVDWNKTGADTSNSAPSTLNDTYPDGTLFTYYNLSSSNAISLQGNMGGFSIAASAVSAIPEPVTTGALIAGGILAAALWVRRRRSRKANVER